ncbi:hypothetical protein ACFO0S_09715 [Chryseomicrobium palamuruense]|uniref:Uncharacterized protein n=1 Tax=Chryseomicrobium palamuruense TaxID=682973 RepID=A0ABV8UXQ0_9BACL
MKQVIQEMELIDANIRIRDTANQNVKDINYYGSIRYRIEQDEQLLILHDNTYEDEAVIFNMDFIDAKRLAKILIILFED